MPIDPASEDFKYWAFISYSHSDEKWAEWLHKSIETYNVPKHLVGKPTREGVVPKRAFPVFRDRDELPGSANLGENIEAALRLSRYLIVICSPRAVQSSWVDKEIRMFKSWGREDRVLCLIVDGEPNASARPELRLPECLPAAIRYWVDASGQITEIPTEPIAADARKGKDGKRNALLKLLAGILGLNFSDLKDREQERKERRLKIVAAAVLMLLLTFSGMGIAFYFQRNEAIQAKKVAEREREFADKARENAEHAYSEAQAAYEKERVAREAEEEARKLAEEAAVKEREAKEIAVVAREKEAEARAFAEKKRIEAEEKERTIRQTLSLSDLNAAARLIEENSEAKALAYVSRALRYDAENPAVVARAVSLLSQRNWPIQVFEPLRHQAEVRSAQYNASGTLLATLSEEAVFLWDARTGKPFTEPLHHTRKINIVRFSPDGALLVTASSDGTAQLWDAATGKKIREPLAHKDWVLGAIFSPDGSKVATFSQDKTAAVWDVATGKLLGKPLPHDGPVLAAVFTPDGRALVTAAVNAARLWNLETFQPIGVPMAHGGGMACVEVSPDGRLIATGAGDRTARLWEAATGVAVGEPMPHDNWVVSLVFSPDGTRLLTASTDGAARLWEVATRKLLGQPFRHEGPIHSAVFSPNGRQLATASTDGTARIWNAATGEMVTEPLRHLGPVVDARFSVHGRHLLTASADATARVWTILDSRPLPGTFQHDQVVNAAAFSADGKLLATASSDRTRIWDLGTGKLACDPLRHRRAVNHVLFSPDNKSLVTTSDDFTAQLWAATTGKPLHSQPLEHNGAINFVCFSPDGARLLTASSDRTVRLWDVAMGTLVYEPLKHGSEVRAAVFSRSGKLMATASSDRTARVWDAQSGKLLATVQHHSDVLSVDISPDERWLATGSEDRTARVWDAMTGNPVTDAIPHAAAVRTVQFNPGESWERRRVLLTVSDKIARLWEPDSGKATTEPLKHSDPVRAATFSSDGSFVLTAAGNSAYVWDNSGKPVADPFTHAGPIRSAIFSPDGSLIATASADRTAKAWFFTIPGKAPGWFEELVSGVGGYRLDNFGAAELLHDSWNRIQPVLASVEHSSESDGFARWARWFGTPRKMRTLAPFASVTTKAYVDERAMEGTPQALEQALHLDPAHALALVKAARLASMPEQADALSHIAERYEPDNPDVLWVRAQVLQQLNRIGDAWSVMQRAIRLDPRNIASFGPEGDDVNCANLEGAVSQGWLPRGWIDANGQTTLNVTYTRLQEVPQSGASAMEIKVDASGRGQAEVRGPRFIARRNARVLVEGWVRSPTKSPVTVIISQFVEPQQKFKEQLVHSTAEWRQFRVQFNPSQDIGGELRLQVSAGSSVHLGGISIRSE